MIPFYLAMAECWERIKRRAVMKKVVVSLCVALGFLSADPAQANKAISNADLIEEIRDLKKSSARKTRRSTN